MLCDVLPEDRILREELQKQRLVRVILKNEQCVGNTYKIIFVIALFCLFLFWKLSNIHKEEIIHKDLKTGKVDT